MNALLILLLLSCGTERWSVKTLTDRNSINFRDTVKTTIAIQTHLPYVSPSYTEPRLESEDTLYECSVLVVGYKIEADNDIHFVCRDLNTDDELIAEIPDPECDEVKGSVHAQEFSDARTAFIAAIGKPGKKYRIIEPIQATIYAVGSYDHYHRQTGAAPNCRELHPVTGFVCNGKHQK